MTARAIPHTQTLGPFDFSILLIGASGNGKSTFVNSFINYLLGNKIENFVVAVASKNYPNIDPRFDDGLKERNDQKTGKSQTTYAHYYKVCSKVTDNKTILIVDTPGISSTGGISEDDMNIGIIIDCATKIGRFNAIIVVEKSSTNRLNPIVEYNLCRISQVIPKDFESRVVMAFTFNEGEVLFEDEWFPFPIKYKIKINNLLFSIDKTKRSKPGKANDHFNMWVRSERKFTKFLLNLYQMNSIPAIQYSLLFQQYNINMKKITEFKTLLENIEICKNALSSSNPSSTIMTIGWVSTDYYNTICSEHRTLCHEDCALALNETSGTAYFEDCFCMIRAEKRCRVCQCSSEQHVHMKKKPLSERSDINGILEEMKIISLNTSTEEIIHKLEMKQQEVILTLLNTEKDMHLISPKYRISEYLPRAIENLRFQLEKEKDPEILDKIKKDIKLYHELHQSIKKSK